MSRMSRPAPVDLSELSLSAIRGPRADGRWYWRARRSSTRETLWTGWATREEATRQGAELLVKPVTDLCVARPVLRTVGEVVRAWVEAQAINQDLRPETRKVYRNQSRHMLRLLDRLPVEDFKRASLEHYRNTRLQEGVSPRSLKQELISLLSAWNRACQQKLVPYRSLARPQVKVQGFTNNHRTPTEQEVVTILQHLRSEEALAVQILAATGARLNEIMKLPRSAIDTRGRRIHLDGKTGPRDFPLTKELEAMLAGRLDGSDLPVLVMPQLNPDLRMRVAIRGACKRAQVPVFTPHGLRRLAVDRMARAGVEVATAASLTGHSPLVMLNDYRQVRPADLREAALRADVDAVLGSCP